MKYIIKLIKVVFYSPFDALEAETEEIKNSFNIELYTQLNNDTNY